MPTAINRYTGARSSTGLVITVAVHAALGAALLSLGVVDIGKTIITKPITVERVPVPQPERLPPPDVPDEVIDAFVTVPPLDIIPDLPTAPPTGLTPALNPPLPAPGDGGSTVAPQPAPPAPVLVGARLDSRFASRFQPPYPPASERSEDEGVVMVRVRIGTDGRVLAAEVKASSGHRRLDEAAVSHARRAWRFAPATRDGIAVESWREIPVRFELING